MRTLVSNPTHTMGMAVMMIVLFLAGMWVSEVHATMVSSQETHTQQHQELETEEQLKDVRQVLEKKMVAQRLEQLGYTPEEIQSRLDRLSPEELQRVSSRAEQLQAGGNGGTVVTVLAIVVLVLLVLHLTGHDIGL